MKKLLSLLVVSVLSIHNADASWFEKAKDGIIGKRKSADQTIAVKNTPKVVPSKPVVPQRDPKEIKAFYDKSQKERNEFEDKYRKMPAGARETESKNFETNVRTERSELEKELRSMAPDPKETAQEEFRQKINAEQKEFYTKLRSMPAGPKESKRAEFDKNVSEGRKVLAEKIKAMPPDEKETARKEFEEKMRKESQEFFSGKS